MLAVLYITNIVASFLVLIFNNRKKYKKTLITTIITIVSGILFCILMINEILRHMTNFDFSAIWWLLSLVFWDYAFLSDDIENWPSYIISALLSSGVIYFICSNIYFSDYLVYCTEKHDYTQRVAIITTIDGTDSGENIYGEGFSIGLIVSQNPITRIYQYYYRAENGSLTFNEVYESRVEITYIDVDAKPYVEIYYNIDCAGYRNNSKKHVFRSCSPTYHFYIPEGSLANISS